MQLEKLHALKLSYVLCLFSGALVMLGFSTLRGSSAQPSNHVYELRLYHVNEGKMDALIARFGDHTDAIFRRHHMKSIGFWRPEDVPYSQNLFVYILEHPSREEARKNWRSPSVYWRRINKNQKPAGGLFIWTGETD